MGAAGGDGLGRDGCVAIEGGVVAADIVNGMSGFMVVPRNCNPTQYKQIRDYPARRTKFVGLVV